MLQSVYFILELQKSSAFTKLKWSLNTLLLYRLREVELVMIGSQNRKTRFSKVIQRLICIQSLQFHDHGLRQSLHITNFSFDGQSSYCVSVDHSFTHCTLE